MSATTNQQSRCVIRIEVHATGRIAPSNIEGNTKVGTITHTPGKIIFKEQNWSIVLNKKITPGMTVCEFVQAIGRASGLGSGDPWGRDLTLKVERRSNDARNELSLFGTDATKLHAIFDPCGNGGVVVMTVARRTANVNIKFVLNGRDLVVLTNYFVVTTDYFSKIMEAVKSRGVDLAQYKVSYEGERVFHYTRLAFMDDKRSYDFVCTSRA